MAGDKIGEKKDTMIFLDEIQSYPQLMTKGLRDRYIGSLFRVDEPVPDDSKLTNGILIEPGMSVEVATVSAVNPINANGGQAVADAFMRVYCIDLKKAGALNSAYLESIIIQ